MREPSYCLGGGFCEALNTATGPMYKPPCGESWSGQVAGELQCKKLDKDNSQRALYVTAPEMQLSFSLSNRRRAAILGMFRFCGSDSFTHLAKIALT